MRDVSAHAICVFGYPASGKSEAFSVADELGIPRTRMGDRVREQKPESYDSAGKFATDARAENGGDIIAEWTLDHLHEEGILPESEEVMIDGVRSVSELERFEDAFDEFTVVFVDVPRQVRLERMRNRAQERYENGVRTDRVLREKDADMEYLQSREDQEEGWGLDELIEEHDIEIKNTGSLDAFRTNISLVLTGEVSKGELGPRDADVVMKRSPRIDIDNSTKGE